MSGKLEEARSLNEISGMYTMNGVLDGVNFQFHMKPGAEILSEPYWRLDPKSKIREKLEQIEELFSEVNDLLKEQNEQA